MFLVFLLLMLAGQSAPPPVSMTFMLDAEQRLVVTVQPRRGVTIRSIALDRYDWARLRQPLTLERRADRSCRAVFERQRERVTVIVTLSDGAVHRLDVEPEGAMRVETSRGDVKPPLPGKSGE
jgi:hypothetical protein